MQLNARMCTPRARHQNVGSEQSPRCSPLDLFGHRKHSHGARTGDTEAGDDPYGPRRTLPDEDDRSPMQVPAVLDPIDIDVLVQGACM